MKPSELPGARSLYRLTNRALLKIESFGNMPAMMASSGLFPPGSSRGLENTAHRSAALGQAAKGFKIAMIYAKLAICG